MPKIISIFGPPGTGKTTKLVNIVRNLIKTTCNIAIVSFTKAGAQEIGNRIVLQVPNSEIRFVGTLHSCAYRELEMARTQVLNVDRFKKQFGSDDVCDEFLLCYSQHKAQDISFEEAVFTHANLCSFSDHLAFLKEYASYKEEHCVFDFFDMIANARQGIKNNEIDAYEYVIVDEAQDLTVDQYLLAKALTAEKGTLYLAGDDDQAIYSFAGCDPTLMIREADEKVFLTESHRLPKAVHTVATQYIKSIPNRQDKTFSCREGEEGVVEFIGGTYEYTMFPERHTVLVTDRYKIAQIEQSLLSNRVEYTTYQHKGYFATGLAQKIRHFERNKFSVLRKYKEFIKKEFHDLIDRGEKPELNVKWTDFFRLDSFPIEEVNYVQDIDIYAEPKVHISTIHGFKGKEAENIVCNGNLNNANQALFHSDPDSFHRLWYVAITRAKKNLFIIGDLHIKNQLSVNQPTSNLEAHGI